MNFEPIPSYHLYTNDRGELLRPEAQRLGAALRYTDPRFRGLFGGIWRAGRIYETQEFGPSFGPEIYYSVGRNDEESWAAFGEPRKTVYEREADVAQRAFDYVFPIAKSFEGRAYLSLAGRSTDTHRLHVFMPTRTVMRRFTPAEWFAFWKDHDSAFKAQLSASEPHEQR